jgi:hypothetical protein
MSIVVTQTAHPPGPSVPPGKKPWYEPPVTDEAQRQAKIRAAKRRAVLAGSWRQSRTAKTAVSTASA